MYGTKDNLVLNGHGVCVARVVPQQYLCILAHSLIDSSCVANNIFVLHSLKMSHAGVALIKPVRPSASYANNNRGVTLDQSFRNFRLPQRPGPR